MGSSSLVVVWNFVHQQYFPSFWGFFRKSFLHWYLSPSSIPLRNFFFRSCWTFRSFQVLILRLLRSLGFGTKKPVASWKGKYGTPAISEKSRLVKYYNAAAGWVKGPVQIKAARWNIITESFNVKSPWNPEPSLSGGSKDRPESADTDGGTLNAKWLGTPSEWSNLGKYTWKLMAIHL